LEVLKVTLSYFIYFVGLKTIYVFCLFNRF